MSIGRRLAHPLVAVALAVGVTVPWVVLELAGRFESTEAGEAVVIGGQTLGTGGIVVVSGIAVLGASFLLAWGAETAEKDVPPAFAIAVLAVLAVAPEYAVDALYAWTAGGQAGTPEGAEAANLAVANMTGANRILIGVGWSGIALFTLYRALSRSDIAVESRPGFLADRVTLDREISLEVTLLFLATLWAFLIPLGGGIDAIDTLVLVGIYVAYILLVLRGDVDEHTDQVGVPRYLQSFPRPRRIVTVLALFGYSGTIIFTAVEPFAHGLEGIGEAAGVPSFFMIQWVAPLASESPELIVVVYLVNKARSTAGFNALISSKLNQWTLLIGTLAVVYSLALGQYGTLPFDAKQAAEIWLTAAQSYFALAILVNFTISGREALALLGLFLPQVVLEFAVIRTPSIPIDSIELLYAFTVVYMLLGTVLLIRRRKSLAELLDRTRTTIRTAFAPREGHVEGAD